MKNRRTHVSASGGLLFALLLLSATGCASRNVEAEPRAISSVTEGPRAAIPIRDLHGLPVVDLRVGGEVLPFLLDTGGGVTVLSPEVVQKLGLMPYGRLTGFRMSGQRVDMPLCDDVELELAQGVHARIPSVGVFDINALVPADWPRFGGLVALTALRDLPFTLDLEGRVLTLESPSSFEARTANMQPMRYRTRQIPEDLTLTVFVATATRPTAWLMLDSGNDGELIVSKHAPAGAMAPAHGFDGGTTQGGPMAMTVHLDGLAPVTLKARVADLIYDGNIGRPGMQRWLFSFDLRNHRLFAAPSTASAGGR